MRKFCAISVLLLTGCVKQPDIFAPPEQRRPLIIDEDTKLSNYVAMNASNASDHFVQDILPELNDGKWRWTLKRPALQFKVPTTKGLRFRATLSVPEITFQQTGPVEIAIYIGPHQLDTLKVAKTGEIEFEKDVPEEWLATEAPVIARFEIDKLWVSPTDGVQRGFILLGAGFVQ